MQKNNIYKILKITIQNKKSNDIITSKIKKQIGGKNNGKHSITRRPNNK